MSVYVKMYIQREREKGGASEREDWNACFVSETTSSMTVPHCYPPLQIRIHRKKNLPLFGSQ